MWFKKYKYQLIFHILINVVVSVFITYSSYYHTPLLSFNGYFAFAIHFSIVQFSVFGFLYFLTINKYLFYLIFPLLFLSFSLFSFWIYIQDISVTKELIQAIIETNPHVIIELTNLPFVIYFILLIVVLVFILKKYSKININQLSSPLIYIAILGILTYFIVEKYKHNTLNRRMPISLIIGIGEYFQESNVQLSSIKNSIASKDANIPNIIFILGESVRADHLQLNGYHRKTTPLLSKNKNVISFSNMFTPYGFTAVSVPQILTNISIEKPKPPSVYSIYTVLNKLNYQTIWIGNQSPENSYQKYIEENNEIYYLDPFHSVLSFQKKKDKEMVPIFNTKYKFKKRQFITLQMIGSHWWYENRYSDKFRKFTPVIKSKFIPSNSKEEMINSYDNSVLYLDSFINDIIAVLEKSKNNTLLIYVSDHGEMLGENGKWLHENNQKGTNNPAVLLWYSDMFRLKNLDLILKLENNANKRIKLDFFYHSILDILKVEGISFDKSSSIFRDNF